MFYCKSGDMEYDDLFQSKIQEDRAESLVGENVVIVEIGIIFLL